MSSNQAKRSRTSSSKPSNESSDQSVSIAQSRPRRSVPFPQAAAAPESDSASLPTSQRRPARKAVKSQKQSEEEDRSNHQQSEAKNADSKNMSKQSKSRSASQTPASVNEHKQQSIDQDEIAALRLMNEELQRQLKEMANQQVQHSADEVEINDDHNHYDSSDSERSSSSGSSTKDYSVSSKEYTAMLKQAKDNYVIWPIPKRQVEGRSRSTSTHFFQRFERVLDFYTRYQDNWIRILPHCMSESWAQEWVYKNIVQKKLSWTEAKQTFANHFDKVDDFSQLFHEFDNLHQGENESVQEFASIFDNLLNQLQGLGTEKFKSHSFISKLNSRTQAAIMARLATPEEREVLNDFANTVQWSITVARPEILAIRGSSNNTWDGTAKRRSSHSRSSLDGGSKKMKINPKDVCSKHPNSSHTNEKCWDQNTNIPRPPPRNPLPSSSAAAVAVPAHTINTGRSLTPSKNTVCTVCGKIGHFSRDCWHNKTPSSNSRSSSPAPSAEKYPSNSNKDSKSTKHVRFSSSTTKSDRSKK